MLEPDSGSRWFDANASRLIVLLAATVGLGSFVLYDIHDLTTAHYDAKAHLVVARRITDSIRPGYAQMGIHWLPLPHLIYLPFVQIDEQYRSALLPSLISVGAFILSAWLVFRIARRLTNSSVAGCFAAVFLIANANLQYLQTCPLTEPIYLALLLLALDSLIQWREQGAQALPWAGAIWASLGALCRYEGWYFLGGVMVLFVRDFWNSYLPRRSVAKAGALYGIASLLPLVVHFFYLYARVGDSFLHRVVKGNPAPYETFKRPLLSLLYHCGELAQIAAIIPLLLGIVGTVYCLLRCRPLERWAPLFLLWLPSLVNISALYWGLIYRVRYSVLLLPALAIFASLLFRSQSALRRTFAAACFVAMALPWLSWYFPPEWKYRFFFAGSGVLVLPAAALICFLLARAGFGYARFLVVLCVLGMQTPVFEGEYRPILSETLEHEFMERERQLVLGHLRENYDGTRILIDMGRLAPLIYDSQLPVKEFVYNEGEKVEWNEALRAPERAVGWLCAERGDEVWRLLHVDPRWADRYSLAVQTESFLLYRLRSKDREFLIPSRRLE